MDQMTPFEISYRDEAVHVVPRKVGRDIVYIVDFPSRRPPLMLSVATKQGGGRFWTTVPEAKGKVLQDQALKEAGELGRLILTHHSEAVKIVSQ